MPVKILIVDDDKFSAMLFSRLLGDDFKVTLADTVDLALEYVETSTFEIVLTDVNLGLTRNEGLELYQTIRARRDIIQPMILAFTSYATPDEAEKIMALGFDGFFKKPIKPEVLVEFLKTKNILQ
jgi:CheY-like chemotaxis protein